MPGDLNIDTSLLRDAATALGTIPGMRTTSVVDIGDCGSSVVINGIAGFDVWFALSRRTINDRIDALQTDTSTVAIEADRIEAQLAAAMGA